MRPFMLPRALRVSVRHSNISPSLTWVRGVSTGAALHDELTSRSPNEIYDYLSPTPSHLLNITLANFLPESCYPSQFRRSELQLPDVAHFLPLPQGHHLVYFPPQVLSSDLLADGTDPIQSPGIPYVRRMWAGGSLVFQPKSQNSPKLDASRWVCEEKISDVIFKGTGEKEMVFVTIDRHIRDVQKSRSAEIPGEIGDNSAILERRNLVFMKEKTAAAAREDAGRPDRIIKPTHAPDFSVSVTPTQSLLFRFSALSFNAHGIHLDPQYCREVEGHRNLLVHGPLSLVLMLSVLRSQLKEQEQILTFDYRNLAPLYANEEMRVSVRRDKEKGRFDVWIEGRGGGYAVKGSASIG